jgi:hypothetical protein
VLACPKCNGKKNDKTAEEFLRQTLQSALWARTHMRKMAVKGSYFYKFNPCVQCRLKRFERSWPAFVVHTPWYSFFFHERACGLHPILRKSV